jgi:hypothetical protein
VTLKTTTFLDVTPCSLVELCRRFGGKKSLDLLVDFFFLFIYLFFDPEDGRSTFLRKVCKLLVYYTVSRKIRLFSNTALKANSTLHFKYIS